MTPAEAKVLASEMDYCVREGYAGDVAEHARRAVTALRSLADQLEASEARLALAEESARAVCALSQKVGNPCLPFGNDKTLPEAVIEYALAQVRAEAVEGALRWLLVSGEIVEVVDVAGFVRNTTAQILNALPPRGEAGEEAR